MTRPTACTTSTCDLARFHEEHGVQRRHVDALAEAARVAQHAAHFLARRVGLAQPVQPFLAPERVLRAVDVLHLQRQQAGLLLGRRVAARVFDQFAPVLLDLFRARDGVHEDDGAQQGLVPVAGDPLLNEFALRVRERVPAAQQLFDVFQAQAGLAVDGIPVFAVFGHPAGAAVAE